MFYRDNKAEAISAFLSRQSKSFLRGWNDYEKYHGVQQLRCEAENLTEYKAGWEKRRRIEAY